MAKISRFIQLVAPRAGRGSKRLIKLEHPERDGGAPQGCGSKHVLVLGYNDALRSPPQEGVDRNIMLRTQLDVGIRSLPVRGAHGSKLRQAP